MEFMLQSFDIMNKLKNDCLFRSLFWQSVREFFVKLLWLIRLTLVQVVGKVSRYLVCLLSCCSLNLCGCNSQ